jgi:hypothetical protein
VETDDGKKYKYRGVGVLPRAKSYRIKVSHPLRSSAEFLRFSTCHRERTFSNTGKSHEVTFTPSGIERSGSCLLKFEAYDVKGKHGWGILEMESDDETLQAAVLCNGNITRGTVNICQSRTGLVQEIRFSEEVLIPNQLPRCKITERKKAKAIRFKIPNRECVYVFRGVNGRFNKLTLIGTEGVLVPSN